MSPVDFVDAHADHLPIEALESGLQTRIASS